VKKLTPDNFDKEVSSNKVILVDFYSTSCPTCRELKKVLEPLAEEMQDRLRIGTFNIEDDDGDILDQFEINAVPTMVIFTNGIATARQEGMMSKGALVAWIEENLP